MKVAQIIQEKAIQELHSVKKDDSIELAAQKLSALRIGSLLVSPDGNKIDGILSERDIVRDLGVSGSSCLKKKVEELMTKDVKTVNSETETKQAMRIMSDGRFRHLPVVDDGKLIGMISIGDVVSTRLKEMQNENIALTDMISGTTY